MKIGILTFHNAYNYGAVLQTYATQEIIKSYGHDVEVIDYHNNKIDCVYNGKMFRLGSLIRSGMKAPLYIIEKYFYWKRRKAYQRFQKNNINLSENTYVQGDKMSLGNYDVILIGSDQLWNKNITGGYDDVYWGDFGRNSRTHVVAWSVCMNNKDLDETDRLYIKSHLHNFNSISVREEILKNFILNFTDKSICCTLDPTLLLPEYHWIKLCHDVKENNYIFVYAVINEQEVIKFARKMSIEMGKPLVVIRSNCTCSLSKHDKEQCGPEDFLSYIHHADFVITSSFHGTAFSIILKKQFICPAFSINERVNNLLSIAGLNNRVVNKVQNIKEIPPIDYDVVSKKLNEEVIKTELFLSNVLKKHQIPF